MPYASQRQRAAHEARLFQEHMAKLGYRRWTVVGPWPMPSDTTVMVAQPLKVEMAKQAAVEQERMDSMLREGG